MGNLKQRTDMTISLPKFDENGETVIKIYRIFKDRYGALFVRMDESYVPIGDVVGMFKEVQLNA